MKILYAIGCLMFISQVNAQISFSLSGEELTEGYRSGSPIASIDVNGDTYDDLVRLHNGRILTVHLQGKEGEFIETYTIQVGNNAQWNIVAGDLNNDGVVDFSTSGVNDKVKVLMGERTSFNYTLSSILDERFYAQGANMADANNDGFLDLHVCNDDAENALYINDTEGDFFRDTSLIDFRTIPVSDNSGNYGSVWTDFDLDGDIDLYISKCRVGVVDPTDPRRINTLYVQNDTGYLEMADTFGLADGGQSWCSDFADIDNDGDFDLLVVNHDVPAVMYENIGGGEYKDITESSGLNIAGVIIQSIFKDFDNDGLLDLFISGSVSTLFRNMGNNVFMPVEDILGSDFISSFSIGDFNNDGFPDIYAAYNELYNSPSLVLDDKMWMNDANENHFLRVQLVGTECNRNAVGARLVAYTGANAQMREIRAGESYGIGNALARTFGLGQEITSVDSLVVYWPDGNVETHYDLQADRTYNIVEGACATSPIGLDIGPFTNCNLDTFEVTAPDGYASYEWSNGQTTQVARITDPGVYYVSVTDDEGCGFVSEPVSVYPNNEPDEVFIEVVGLDEKCFGDSVILIAPDGLEFQWSDGTTDQVKYATETADYSVTVIRACSTVDAGPVPASLPDPNIFEVENDTLTQPGSGTLFADGDSILWYDAIDALEPIASGQSFMTIPLGSTTAFYAENTIVIPGISTTGGMPDHMGGSEYSNNNLNVGLVFDVIKECTLDSVLVTTDFPAVRKVILLDREGNEVRSREVSIDTGRTYISLGFDLEPGQDYVLATDEETNLMMQGVRSPRLFRSEDFVLFPYLIEDVISIKRAENGFDNYYYFYDWHVTIEDQVCVSERKEALVVIDTTTSTRELILGDASVYPNPASDWITLRLEDGISQSGYTVTITDLNGKTMMRSTWEPGSDINVSGFAPGLYFLELRDNEGIRVGRFIRSDRN